FDHVVYAVAFSPDSKLVVGGGHDGYNSKDGVYFARLWDVATGKELRHFPCGKGSVRALAFAPDGATAAGGGDDARLRIWDVATGKEQRVFPPDGYRIRSVAFAPDGRTVAAAGDSIRLYDPATGKEQAKIERRAIKLHFSPDSATLIGAVSGTIYRWDAATGRTIRPAEGGDSVVDQIEVTADGKRIVTRGQDGDAHVWDARTGEHLRRVNVTWQRGMGLSPDGKFLVWPVEDESVKYKDPAQPNAIHTGNRLRLYDLAEGKLIDRFPGFEGDAHNLDFTPDGKTLVTVDLNNGVVRLWDVATGKEQRSFSVSGEVKGRPYYVWRARLSPDGKTLAVNYQRADNTTALLGPYAVRLWDMTTGKELHHLVGHWYYVEAMAFSPDSRYLVTGSKPLEEFAQEQLRQPVDQVFVWDVVTGKQVARLPIGGTAAAFSPDGRTLAVAQPDNTIQLWDVATWKPRGEFRGHRDRITSMAFTPDGRLLTGSVDTTVLAWDVRAAKGGEPPAKP
ncbi:MAG TPA: WD40 repeat domain-containing protein, partial [Gemmataceae bacterium]|nr:WD40 repeat domain-containing protein [Gemmataceae bacterium]